MEKHLFFICPTDFLETTIQSSFKHRNYYFTSLGNSVVFDDDTIDKLKRLIRKLGITKISFILANNNSIVKDALGEQDFSEVRAMGDFYKEIYKVKKKSDASWQIDNHQYLLLSYYLDKKIKLLKSELSDFFVDVENISGKIYNRENNIFIELYSSLISCEKFSLN